MDAASANSAAVDPGLESVETLVREVRQAPGLFPDVRSLARKSGLSPAGLIELVRRHFHTTPPELLLHARVEAARRALLTGKASFRAIAGGVGVEDLTSFQHGFGRLNGLSPAAFRDLPRASRFEIELPTGYPVPYLARALSRDPHSVTERFAGDRYTTVLGSGNDAAIVRLRLAAQSVRVECPRGSGVEAHRLALRLLGLQQDATGLVKLAESLGFARLTAGRAEMRVTQTQSVFDGLVWSILGQQVNVAFACLLRRRLVILAGRRVADGLYAVASPDAVARLKPADLLKLQFSRQKAQYLIGAARLVADGELDLEGLSTGSATRAERTLLIVHGLGPWAVNYILMRSLGFADCVPLGDTGVTSGLRTLFGLEQRPDVEAVRRLMAVFSPYRSLATAHLWQLNRPSPSGLGEAI